MMRVAIRPRAALLSCLHWNKLCEYYMVVSLFPLGVVKRGRIVYLQEADIVAGDRLDQVLRRRDLAKGHLEMIGI